MESVITFLLTAQPEAALGFYRDKLGLKFSHDDGFALVFDNMGVMLRVAKVPEITPVQSTVLGWECQDIRADVTRLLAAGVVFERYPGMNQDDLGIATFPHGDQVAWFRDPDGNVLSLSQHASVPSGQD